MICELCGKQNEKGFKIRLEGSTVNACHKCSNLGEVVETIKEQKKERKTENQVITKKKAKVEEPEVMVIEDYARIVKNAREKKGLKQDDLGKLINEPSSLIHRIESQRIEPSPKIAKKLEKKLGIKLLEKDAGPNMEIKPDLEKKELTLGDVIVMREKKRKS